MSQPNFVTFTSTRIVHKEPMGGNFTGNQNDGMFYVRFADGSGGIEKHMKDWHGNKTGRLYRAEILAAQEYLASRVGEVMDAPIRDCRFTSTDAKKIVMPALNGQSGEECQNDVCYPPNISGGKLRLFDYLTANADRRPKNIMHTSGGTVGIDHALCNFRPREATPEVVADVWNRGITTDYLEALQPKLEALQPTFHQFAMDDKYQNMMDNLDKLIKAFQILSQYVAITKGDVAGHDFHGNQYEQVGGSSKPHLRYIASATSDFFANGGTVKSFDPTNLSEEDKSFFRKEITMAKNKYGILRERNFEIQRELRPLVNDKYKVIPEKQEQYDKLSKELVSVRQEMDSFSLYGRTLASCVNGKQEGDTKLYVAYNQNGEAQGLLLGKENKTNNSVEAVSSVGDMRHVGTALEYLYAKDTAERGVGIRSEQWGDSTGYHELIGRTLTKIKDGWSSKWTKAQVKEIASLNIPNAVAKSGSFIPPKGVQEAGKRALEWIADGKAGDGFTPVGRKRASDLAHGHNISLDTLKRMKAYFDRHQPDKKAEGFRQSEHGYPSAGRVAWDAWGGDAGYSWAKSMVSRYVQKGDVQGHDFHGNQWKTVYSASQNPKKWSREIISLLANGGRPVISSTELGVLLRTSVKLGMPEVATADITELQVNGTRLMGQDGLGYSRSEMPQIPRKMRDDFVAELAKEGITSTKELVDPTTLQPSQREIGLGRASELFTKADGVIPQNKYLLVSADNYIIDGHHNWAANVAIHLQDPSQMMPIIRVGAPATEVISRGLAWSQNNGIDAKPLGKSIFKSVGELWAKYVAITKGDVQGHDFHGNQYTDTEGHTQVHPDFKFGKEGSLEGAKIDPAKVGEICMSPEYTAFLNKTLGTSHTAVNPWTKEVTEVHPNNAIYGGCLATAEALKLLFPNGEIKAAITTSEAHITDAVAQGYHPMVDHFVLSVGDGKFMDGRGLITEQQATDLNGMGPMRNGLYFNHLVEATPAMIDEKRPMILSPAGAPEALANFITQRAGVSKSVSKSVGEIWAKYALFTIRKGDVKGHNFHGNQYEQVEGEIKPENLKLPSGWRLASQDEKTYTITSDKGNSALFNKGAVPYKIGTLRFQGGEKDFMDDGKKDVWTPENPIAVAALKSVDAQATGKTIDFATSAGEEISSYGAATNPNDTSVIKIGKLSTINDSIAGTLPSDTMGIVAGKDDWAASKVFSDPAKMMEVTITHELGHIDFTDRGLSVDDIKEALSKTKEDLGIEKMPNWSRLETNYLKKVSDSYAKSGREVPTEILDTKMGRGSTPQSDTGKKWLQSVGATKYGSSRLQECYAECYAIWHTPNFAITPLVANMASVAGWGERPKGNA